MEDDQATYIRSQSHETLSRRFVDTAADLYPDVRMDLSSGYARRESPLIPLTLLYDRVVAYVPPRDPKGLELRWGLPWTSFLDLVDAGLIQPLVGHLTDYTAPHFQRLLARKVPSVWTRGLTLLEELGLSHTLEVEDYNLPFEAMLRSQPVQRKFRKAFPYLASDQLRSRIYDELLTNLADLALFGEWEVIKALEACASIVDPGELARNLFLLNELRTYPQLFGLGGTASYDDAYTPVSPAIVDLIPQSSASQSQRILSDGYQALLHGIGIDLTQVPTEDIIAFHETGDAHRLRQLVSRFEREARRFTGSHTLPDPESLFVQAEALNATLREVAEAIGNPHNRRSMHRIDKGTYSVLRLGGIALGGWIALELGIEGGHVFEAIGGAGIFELALVPPLRSLITKEVIDAKFRPGVATMWKMSKRIRRP